MTLQELTLSSEEPPRSEKEAALFGEPDLKLAFLKAQGDQFVLLLDNVENVSCFFEGYTVSMSFNPPDDGKHGVRLFIVCNDRFSPSLVEVKKVQPYTVIEMDSISISFLDYRKPFETGLKKAAYWLAST